MLNKNKNSRRGFTITEILIAVLLVLILSAIAVPRLLGNQRQADDAAAKAQLRTAGEVARNLMYEYGNSFHQATDTKMDADEPNIDFVSGPSTVSGRTRSVSVMPSTKVSPANTWIGASEGGANGSTNVNCWYIRLDTKGSDLYAVKVEAKGACDANTAPAAPSGPTTLGQWKQYDFPDAP
jgi:prepilin-type N-terminal cleavage/methylation domain-containing protein